MVFSSPLERGGGAWEGAWEEAWLVVVDSRFCFVCIHKLKEYRVYWRNTCNSKVVTPQILQYCWLQLVKMCVHDFSNLNTYLLFLTWTADLTWSTNLFYIQKAEKAGLFKSLFALSRMVLHCSLALVSLGLSRIMFCRNNLHGNSKTKASIV